MGVYLGYRFGFVDHLRMYCMLTHIRTHLHIKRMVVVPKLPETSQAKHGTRPFEVYKVSIADVDGKRDLLWHGTGLLKI